MKYHQGKTANEADFLTKNKPCCHVSTKIAATVSASICLTFSPNFAFYQKPIRLAICIQHKLYFR
jgi:hypothetical protein